MWDKNRLNITYVISRRLSEPAATQNPLLKALMYHLAEVGHQVDEVREVGLDLLRREAPHQVQGTVQLLVRLKIRKTYILTSLYFLHLCIGKELLLTIAIRCD